MCWPMAFRYDLAVRTTVLTFRNADGDLANPGIRDKTLEQNALQDSERLQDFRREFADVNPYAEGQVKHHINPISGEVYKNQSNQQGNSSQFNSLNNHGVMSSKPNARSWAYANNQPAYEGPGSFGFQSNSWDDRGRSGYGQNTRGRGCGGGWHDNSNGHDNTPPGRRNPDRYESCRGESSGSWRRNEKRNDRRGDECDYNTKFGNNGKAK
ncbi:uncharacterized protein MELLADRAFT_93094 [Melampsora larici-populina 98AG31]|uniref:Uncharacterized protein n=1 Tax=Melampsora larici-populina (strain 98AG31 / pathotype 3-4-7) TaxID=747676 RepID=F4S3X5_MELLP|nr:uncharacterized protein MELLADRAFT_93094 [Melampsora larici-populina 98AG31]EGG00608.1 hypothetical protein MELLADRAFT_93094 [Melampsora larici-populina 98AG31]